MSNFPNAVYAALTSAQPLIGDAYLSEGEILTILQLPSDDTTLAPAINELVKAGLVQPHPTAANHYRARGHVAVPGPEETPMPQTPCKRRHEEPAAAAQYRQESIRREALARAIEAGDHDGPDSIVASAAAFEAYLTGPVPAPGYLDKPQIAQIKEVLEDAESTLGMLDTPETTNAVRAAIKFLGSFLK